MAKVWLICLILSTSLFAEEIVLFNGRNLDGFYSWLLDSGTNDPRKVFSATNNLLRISGDGLGYLSTKQDYSNYILRLEFKWGITNTHWGDRLGKARDSGLFIHSFGPDGNSVDGGGAFKAAVECQIMEGAVGDFLLIRGKGPKGQLLNPAITARIAPHKDADGWFFYDPNGTITNVERWGRINRLNKSHLWKDKFGFKDPLEKPAGQWNLLEVDARGRSIKLKLNGKLVNVAETASPAAGKILLQCEGSEIYFRNLVLEQH